jgi:hypothetical protein
MRMATFDGLEADEADEMAMVLDVRERQSRRRRLRTELLTIEGDRVGVAARIHLLGCAVERELGERLVVLEDELALLRHCPPDASRRDGELARAEQQRTLVHSLIAGGSCAVDTVIGRPPTRGADWSLADLPWALLNEANLYHARLRDELVETVDNIIDADLLVLRTGRAGSPDGIAEFDLAEHDLEAVAQVTAFAVDVEALAAYAEQSHARLRFIALRRSVEHPRDWLLNATLRRREARRALDRSRAVHAALAEIRQISSD